ncbi:MAG: hypothetical protein VX403_04565 [Planctomycetota bacterium]|nr:hypothetical protein [Planctomycetota bacterium]
MSCAITLAILPCLLQVHDVVPKDVNAPPGDITAGHVVLPGPEQSATSSVTALLPAREIDRFVPGSGKSAVVLIAKDPELWDFSIGAGSQPLASSERLLDLSGMTQSASARALRLLEPSDGLTSMPIQAKAPDEELAGWLLVADGCEDVRLTTHFGTRHHAPGRPVVLHARMEGAHSARGTMVLGSPSGDSFEHPLHPDGAGGLIGVFSPDEAGDWTVRSIVESVDHRGVGRVRTTQQLLRSLPESAAPSGSVTASQQTDGRIEFRVPLSVLPAPDLAAPRRVALAFEVWATDASGRQVPVCWVSRIHELPAEGGAQHASLRADPRWFSLAGADPKSIELRELRIHDTRGFVLLAHEPRPDCIPVGSFELPSPPSAVVPSMHAGAAPERIAGASRASSMRAGSPDGGHVLLLSHGYCTDQFPFRTNDFSGDFVLYEEYGQNLSNDEFALRFESLGRSHKSMGIVGHSQAGHAATHLYTFYWSALDWATGPRKIQGVGVPWLGTALAGNAAVLGEVFGIGCGEVYDLTYDGSTSWLSFIPSWVRQETWYWTTSFEDGWFDDDCQIVTDLLLSDPDDGTVEQYAGQLAGANNEGHKTGWCHTRLMRDPPQCRDAERNVLMNQEAAR